MKSIHRLALLVAAIFPATALGQSFNYNFNVPAFSFSITDSAVGQGSGAVGFLIPLSTVSETLEIVGTTVREYGTWNIPAFTLSNSVSESRTIAPVFPNPPAVVTGLLTGDVTAAAVAIPFDTGFRPWTWTGTGARYSVPSFNVSGSIPMTAAYTLVTGGDTHGESKAASQGVALFSSSSVVDAINFPSSLPLTQSWSAASGGVGATFTPYTAPNGFQANVRVVPEPSSVGLSLAAFGALLSRRVRRMRGMAAGKSV